MVKCLLNRPNANKGVIIVLDTLLKPVFTLSFSSESVQEHHIQESKSTSESETEDEHEHEELTNTHQNDDDDDETAQKRTSKRIDYYAESDETANAPIQQLSENGDEPKAAIIRHESNTRTEVSIPVKTATATPATSSTTTATTTTAATSSSVSARVLRRLPDNRISFFMQLQRDEQV